MRERFRSFDSKISFFAFADIITAVSGMLIFITLLLATDLGRPTSERPQAANAELEQKLQKTLSHQADVDAQNRRMQELLAAADTAPAAEKLRADITRLQTELDIEQKKHADVADQLAASQSAIEARDQTLGLTGLKSQIQQVLQEASALAQQDAKVRGHMAKLGQRIAAVEFKVLQLRGRAGKLWLIPDKSSTTKEPVLATVSGGGLKVERFDQPAQAKGFTDALATSGFESYLRTIKPQDQYIVFMVKPKGIELFEHLVKLAREKGFEVGFDALEENRELHFTTPPPLDETPTNTPPAGAAGTAPPAAQPVRPAVTNSATTVTPAAKPSAPPAAANTVAPATKPKSWWQRLMEFIGLA